MEAPDPQAAPAPFLERGNSREAETADVFMPKFDANGLVPCITQDAGTGEVLMFAFMNAEALRLTIETGCAHYFSRSRNRLWKKGETSGHVQRIAEIRTDCDQDVVLLRVEQTAAACHTGYRSCFFRRLISPPQLERTETARVFDASKVYGTVV